MRWVCERERGEAVGENEVFKTEIGEEDGEIYADMGNNRDGFGLEEILEGRDMGVRTTAEVFVCRDEVGEEDVFAIQDKIWLTIGGAELEERRKMEEVAEIGL